MLVMVKILLLFQDRLPLKSLILLKPAMWVIEEYGYFELIMVLSVCVFYTCSYTLVTVQVLM